MSFPTTSVLDDANRADNPSSLGANWTDQIESGFVSLGILANRFYAASGFQGNYWNTSFGANQEVFVTVPVMPVGGRFELWARIQSPGGSGVDGYRLQINDIGSSDVSAVLNDAGSFLFNGGSTYAAGDQVGLQLNGTNIELFRNGASDGSATDSTVTVGGFIGMQIIDTTTRLDNFGGGNIVTSTATYGPAVPGSVLGWVGCGVKRAWHRRRSGIFIPERPKLWTPDVVTA